MRFDDVMHILANSTPEEWHYVPCHSGEGSAYVDQWQLVNEGSDNWFAEHKNHPHRATYKGDVNLTIAYGMELRSNASYTWLEEGFPSVIRDQVQVADYEAIDIFWAGSLIERRHYFALSSESVKIPAFQHDFSEDRVGTVTEAEVSFLETVDALENNGFPVNKAWGIRSATERVGISIV